MRHDGNCTGSRIAIGLLILGALLAACEGEITSPGATDPTTLAVIDAGDLVVGVPVAGTFAYNPHRRDPAAEFPRGSGKHLFRGAGLWLSALVGGEVQSTITRYATEYTPGTIGGNTDDPRFRTYKVAADDSATAPDVLAWPADLGAPVDDLGQPAVPAGGQIAWSLYHDAVPGQHTILFGTGLGAELRRSVFGWSEPSALRRAVMVRWRLTNRSAEDWQELYLGFWADAELGGRTDDLCGSDSTLGLGYVYNQRDVDVVYSSQPPAAGISLLAARDSLGTVPLELTFNCWLNGEEPTTEQQARRLLMASQANGTPNPHAFLFPGAPDQPDQPAGSLDPEMGDKRMVIAAGPFEIPAGAWLELDGLLLASQAPGPIPRLASVAALRVDFQLAWEALVARGMIED